MLTAHWSDRLDQAVQAERAGRLKDAIEALRAIDETETGTETEAEAGEVPVPLELKLRLGRLLVHAGASYRVEAEAVLRQARAAAERLGASSQAAEAIHMLALLERRHGRWDEAEKLLEQSPVANDPTASGAESGPWHHYRGLIDADRGNLNGAERSFYRAYQHYQGSGHESGLAELCDSLANLLLRRGNTRAALAFAQTSLGLKRRLHDRFGEAVTLGTLGRVSIRQARYPEARRAFLEDLAIARELGDDRGVGIMLNSLGEVALLLREFEAAADYYRQNLNEDRGPVNRIHALLGLARVHLGADRLDDAAAACQEMSGLLSESPCPQSLRDAHRGLQGALAWRRGALPEGEGLLNEAIEGLSRGGYDLETLPFLYELRDLYQQRGARADAVRVMGRALDLLCACGAERGVEDVEEWLRTVDSPGLIRVALERHFPQWLVDDILSGRLRRPRTLQQEVTVLFCDLRDYTTLSEGLPPERVVDLLNEWFAEATRAIQQFGGVVDKFIGDAIMAVFGVPEPRADAAANAVRAALAMREALSLFNERQHALGGPEIRFGIGIDTGEAVVGFIGSHLQQSYAAIGTPTNTASRLEAATKDYPGCDILISQRTQELQQRDHVAETTFLGYPPLKGRTQKVGVYQVNS